MAGASYGLSFYVGSAEDATSFDYFHPATIDLSINGGPRVSYTNPNAPTDMLNWKQFTAAFVATGPSTTITFLNGSASNNFLSALDNVTITELSAVPLPEPASLTLWGLGAMGAAFGAYRRRRAGC